MVSVRNFLRRNVLIILASGSSLVIGSYLLTYAWPPRIYKPNQQIWDAIWLDGWGLLFLATLTALFLWRRSERIRARLLLVIFCWYGLVTMTVIFAGTDFGMNGIWGDQKFRIAMILKMATWIWPGDYYYADLPAHYPPLLYWLQAMVARLFSIEAYRMIKLGSLAIYGLGPILSYLLWRRLVTPMRAVVITIASFLFASVGKPMPLLAPHAFLSNLFFIPWWLYFVEGTTAREPTLRHWLVGSLIGGGLFMTYYFPFFIGGFVLAVRLTGQLIGGRIHSESKSYWKSAAIVLGGAAIASAVFWLPFVLAIFEHGLQSAQQRWHHAGSTGILFNFQSFSVPGMIFLASLYYGLRRHWSPICHALLWLLGGAVGFYLVGALLGALDRPVNLIKANEFVTMLAGPFVGLSASALLRWSLKGHTRRIAVAILILIGTGFFVDRFNALVRHEMVTTARKAKVPDWGLTPEVETEISGKVILTRHEELFCFYPAYSFISINEHYSNPTSRFPQRYEMLKLLEGIDDRLLFNVALRTNKYDPIEYFMPQRTDSSHQLVVALSNYPDRYTHQWLNYPLSHTGYSDISRPLPGNNLYSIGRPVRGRTAHDTRLRSTMGLDQIHRLICLRQHLTPEGRAECDRYVKYDVEYDLELRPLLTEGDRPLVGGIARLIDARLCRVGGSSTLLLALKAEKETPENYRVMAHLFNGAGMKNLDFDPPTPTSSWSKGDIMFVQRELPDREALGHLVLGFFNEKGNRGDAVELEL